MRKRNSRGHIWTLIIICLILIVSFSSVSADIIISGEYDIDDIKINDIIGVTKCIIKGDEYIVLKNGNVQITKDFEIIKNANLSSKVGVQNAVYNNGLFTGLFVVKRSDGANFPTNTIVVSSDKNYYDMGITTSTDGENWKHISGTKKRSGTWQPNQSIYTKNGKIVAFVGGKCVISEDGTNFTYKDITINNPMKLGYVDNYQVEESVPAFRETIFNGEYFVTYQGNYFDTYIMRSADGYNWDKTILTHSRNDKGERPGVSNQKIFAAAGKFYVFDTGVPKYYVSSDGLNWEEKDVTDSVLCRKVGERYQYSNIIHGDGYFVINPSNKYNGAFFQGVNIYSGTNKLYISRDLEKFYEIDLGRDIDHLRYVDRNYLITSKEVFDFKKILEYTETMGTKYTSYAKKLDKAGMFSGTEYGYELDSPFTRLQSAVMIVRLLGMEQEALDKNYEHPFTDVPWGDAYVGYLYHEGLTTGVSETEFGANNLIGGNTYMVLLLRAMGYNDKEGDFDWTKGLEFARDSKLISKEDYTELRSEDFLRDHVAKYSYLALNMKLKSGKTLGEKLVQMKIIDKDLIK